MPDKRLKIYLNRDGSYDATRGDKLLHFYWSHNMYKIYGVKLINIGPNYVPSGRLVSKPHIQMILQVQNSFGDSNESIKNFEQFNESIRDQMTPKTKEKIMLNLKGDINNEFHPTTREPLGSTSKMGVLDISYEELVKIFGKPNDKDGMDGKIISSSWRLEDSHGRIVYIHDWKSTRLYNRYDIVLPTFSEFKHLPSYDWSISGYRNYDRDSLVDDLRTYVYLKISQ